MLTELFLEEEPDGWRKQSLIWYRSLVGEWVTVSRLCTLRAGSKRQLLGQLGRRSKKPSACRMNKWHVISCHSYVALISDRHDKFSHLLHLITHTTVCSPWRQNLHKIISTRVQLCTSAKSLSKHLREGSDIYNVLPYHAWLKFWFELFFFGPKACAKKGCKAKQTSNELVLGFKKKKKAIRFELNIC